MVWPSIPDGAHQTALVLFSEHCFVLRFSLISCSIGFKPGDSSRPFHNFNRFVEKILPCDSSSECRALSCMRIKSWPIAPANGLTPGWIMSFTYLTAVRLRQVSCDLECKFHPIPSQTLFRNGRVGQCCIEHIVRPIVAIPLHVVHT